MVLPVTPASVQKLGQVGTLTEAVQGATGPPSPSCADATKSITGSKVRMPCPPSEWQRGRAGRTPATRPPMVASAIARSHLYGTSWSRGKPMKCPLCDASLGPVMVEGMQGRLVLNHNQMPVSNRKMPVSQ